MSSRISSKELLVKIDLTLLYSSVGEKSKLQEDGYKICEGIHSTLSKNTCFDLRRGIMASIYKLHLLTSDRQL